MTDASRRCIYSGSRELRAKRVGVLGLARSGVACLRFLAERGARPVAMDARPLGELNAEAREAARLAELTLAPYGPLADALPLDLLVISPGVPTEAAILHQARAAGIEVIGETELAYRFFDAPLAAITGTSGKGTTVTVLGGLLSAGGMAHVVAGNIGQPLISEADRSGSLAVGVAEISSFQLETTVHFHPHIAALLNITEDHLERYPGFEAYVRAKEIIFHRQTGSDFAIFCADDPQARTLLGCGRATSLRVALHDPEAHGRLQGEELVLQLPGGPAEVMARRGDLALPADHHVINHLVAGLAARLLGVPAEVMAPAVREYRPAPHLMERVAEGSGVRWVDDSKATNPASALADLRGIQGPVIVIAGGKEKDTDFGEFGRELARRARRVILLGECADLIARAVGSPKLCVKVGSMEEAVSVAAAEALPGDTVALCPACSSLDMFESYARRGELFAQAARKAAGSP